MKIPNETKIGALTAVSITLLILGYNFLKGKDLFVQTKKIYSVFKNVEGLETSNVVTINGLEVGSVYQISAADQDLSGIVVTINLKKDVHIPKNSYAVISPGLINSSSITITKGDATEYLANGDTLATQEKLGLLNQVERNINPLVGRLNSTLGSLDSLVQVVGSLFDPKTKNNISAIFAHLAVSTASLEGLLNMQTSTLGKSLNNLDTFTSNLNRNNDRITRMLTNLDKTTSSLADSKIQQTIETIQSTMTDLRTVINKINNGNGSLGLLVNDKKLYQNLESTSRSLNTLLDDVRVHPKRYVNISVFGRKDKSGPLTAPINDTSSKSVTH
jgi:phospholipid/cholesterol/gamma-HCH transport system substrate-binding protein